MFVRSWVLSVVCLSLCLCVGAQQVQLLSDLSSPLEWKTYQWNKAPGKLSASDHFPEALRTAEGEPRRSLAVAVDWPAGPDFSFFSIVPASPLPPIPFNVLALSVWVRGSGTGHGLEAHFKDAAGKDVKVSLGALDFGDWRRLRAKIPTNLAQPLTFDSLTLHNWGLVGPDRVTVCFARLEVTVDPSKKLVPLDGTPALTLQTTASDGLVDSQGKTTLRVGMTSWQPENTALTLHHSLRDWNGQVTPLGDVALELTGNGKQEVPVALPRFGPYLYRAEAYRAGEDRPLAVLEQPLTWVRPVPKLTAAQRAGSSIGVNTHYQAHWETLARLGVHWARDYSWGWLKHGERAPDADNGVHFAPTWKAAQDAGITLLPVMMGAFRNAANNGFLEDAAEIRQAYERLARAFPEIPYWELDNEADYAFPGRTFSLPNYENYIRAANAGLRAAGTGSVVLNGTAGILYDEAVQLLKGPAADDFAVVNSHFYTGTMAPELGQEDVNVGGQNRRVAMTYLDQMRRINDLAHAAGKESWLTEIGWDVAYGPAVGERLQAVYLARIFLLGRFVHTDKTFWYFDRDVENSTTKFASCGLLDLKHNVRPAGAALAQVSAETALATYGGSVDLGPDRWCLLFRGQDGKWLATAWTMQQDHPLPPELRGVEAYDLFGNPVTPTHLTGEVTYFHLGALPAAWDGQRQAELQSPTMLKAVAGEPLTIRLSGVRGARWEQLPVGIEAAGTTTAGTLTEARLRLGPATAPGEHAVTLVGLGDGWERRWPLKITVSPLVVVEAGPYTAGQATSLRLHLSGHAPRSFTITLPVGVGTVVPAAVSLDPDQSVTVTLTPAPDCRGPVALELKSDDFTQTVTLRPAALSIPACAAEYTLDGDLHDWNGTPLLEGNVWATNATDFAPRLWASWRPEALWLAVEMPIAGLNSADPRSFWDWANLELFVDRGASGGQGWGPTAHQLWFVPVQEDGKWRLYAGEWKRGEAIAATIYDDKRCQTALRVADGKLTAEIAVPMSVLGPATASPGELWRLGIALQSPTQDRMRQAAWPVLKDGGLLEGTQNLGAVTLAP